MVDNDKTVNISFDLGDDIKDIERYALETSVAMDILWEEHNNAFPSTSLLQNVDDPALTKATNQVTWQRAVSNSIMSLVEIIKRIDTRLLLYPTTEDMEAHTVSQYRRCRELDDKKIKQHFQYHDTQANTMLNRIQALENDSLEDLGKLNKLKNELETEMNNAKKFLSKIQVNLENPGEIQRSSTMYSNVSTIPHCTNDKPPIFKDEPNEKPIKFLNELKRCIEFVGPDPASLNYYLGKSLEGEAQNWWYLIQQDVKSWEDFETEFRDQYWNNTVQQSLHWRIGHGTYYSSKNISRVQYATQILSIGQDLGLPEATVLATLPNHFDRSIKPHLFKLSRKDMIDMLGRFDNDDRIAKAKKAQYERNENNKNTQNNQNSTQNQNSSNQSQNRRGNTGGKPQQSQQKNTNTGRSSSSRQNKQNQPVDVNAIEHIETVVEAEIHNNESHSEN